MGVRRFAARLGIPRSTWYAWRAAQLAGRPVARWPAPVVDELQAPAAQTAQKWSAWGHRKIWAMMRADGVTVSASSVYRALKRENLLLPQRYHAERRAMAAARKQAFIDPPTRRNRVWQTDFTHLEITSGGTLTRPTPRRAILARPPASASPRPCESAAGIDQKGRPRPDGSGRRAVV